MRDRPPGRPAGRRSTPGAGGSAGVRTPVRMPRPPACGLRVRSPAMPPPLPRIDRNLAHTPGPHRLLPGVRVPVADLRAGGVRSLGPFSLRLSPFVDGDADIRYPEDTD